MKALRRTSCTAATSATISQTAATTGRRFAKVGRPDTGTVTLYRRMRGVKVKMDTECKWKQRMRYPYAMRAKPRPPRAAPSEILPFIKPLLEPVVEPVLERLDRNEKLLLELKAALDIQFRRTAQIQAQLDGLVARFAKRRK